MTHKWAIWHPFPGFTLIEILVVVTIIVIISAIAIPTWNVFRQDEVSEAAGQALRQLKTARSLAATHRLDCAVAYLLDLRRDSLTGDWVESASAATIVRAIPDRIRDRAYIFHDLDGRPYDAPQRIPESPLSPSYASLESEQDRLNLQAQAFTFDAARDASLRFDILPSGAVIDFASALPNACIPLDSGRWADRLRPIRIYSLTQIDEEHYDAVLMTPLMAPPDLDAPPISARWQYLADMPATARFLSFCPWRISIGNCDTAPALTPDDFTDPRNPAACRFPAIVFTSTGRISTPNYALTRFDLHTIVSPDSPLEDRRNGPDLRSIHIAIHCLTGRAQIQAD